MPLFFRWSVVIWPWNAKETIKQVIRKFEFLNNVTWSVKISLITLRYNGFKFSMCHNYYLALIAVDSIEFNKSQYCFVNECTIKINDFNVLLNIINNTEDWITATNIDPTKDRSTLAVSHDRYCADFTIAILNSSLVCTELLIGVDQANNDNSALVASEDEQYADFFSHKNSLQGRREGGFQGFQETP